MKVGFYRNALIGDTLVALRAIYSIKALYPHCKLVVYTNDIGIEIYQDFDFIDELFNLNTHSYEQTLEHINLLEFDEFILTQPIKTPCNLLAKSNVKRIISLLSPRNFYRLKFHNIFISRNFNSTPQYKRLLRLVREIDKKIFDEGYSKIDFSPITLKPKDYHFAYAQKFLDENYAQNFKYCVMINPYSRTCSHSLTSNGWIKLITILAKRYCEVFFIIPTYEGNPQSFDFPKLQNLKLFYNTLDLYNLIALTSKTNLLISPSTGNAHIANNLNIPLIGIFSKRDTMLWIGENMRLENLVIVPKKREQLTKDDEDKIIHKVIERFEEFCKQ
ncbi:lipopolysaccharide heptosyltransferase family protein [Helicobacter cholecystus]|uniref:Lipopolysaccharide heptosyltransferase family protein n=1 Tax=Helicobacter cholecystus TaxID=45498 RepID=A0A3D8IY79_9HELI|nr:glycosyltransferase family 9 protein [Helicobacter cholecystus]RDU69946.1 lipopolysaccharide heptosyltransferase family protein [Helicobacter cholecystus]VEJ24888.1 Uncharacterised protein [Helicobacter cholecystus]